MKEFRKNEQGLFVCEECTRVYKRINELAIHVNLRHDKQQKYFNKWIKEDGDDKCKICNKITQFKDFACGYKKCCSEECSKKFRCNSYIKTCLNKYGTSNYNNMTKYKTTCLNKYGVENPQQTKEIREKSQKTRFEIHNFKNTHIHYRGSYELDFLEKYYDKYPDIQNGPTIRYKYGNKNKIYFPDFFIPSLNLIIECKNSYLMKIAKKEIKLKEKATIANGFNYEIIIDKNYSNLKI